MASTVVVPLTGATHVSDGKERRAQIDTETVRALLLINGGGAVALVTLLPSLLGKPEYAGLTIAVLVGVLLFTLGLFFAVLHNRLRPKCSFITDQHGGHPPPGKLFGVNLRRPTVCFFSVWCRWLSIAAFFLAGTSVAISGIVVFARVS
jgi:hypothetical protein